MQLMIVLNVTLLMEKLFALNAAEDQIDLVSLCLKKTEEAVLKRLQIVLTSLLNSNLEDYSLKKMMTEINGTSAKNVLQASIGTMMNFSARLVESTTVKHVPQSKNARPAKKVSTSLSRKTNAFPSINTALLTLRNIRIALKMEPCSIIAMIVLKMPTLNPRPINVSHVPLFPTVLNALTLLNVPYAGLTGFSTASSDASLLTFLTARL